MKKSEELIQEFNRLGISMDWGTEGWGKIVEARFEEIEAARNVSDCYSQIDVIHPEIDWDARVEESRKHLNAVADSKRVIEAPSTTDEYLHEINRKLGKLLELSHPGSSANDRFNTLDRRN